MEKELTALFGFLDRFGFEARGREVPAPEGDIAEKLIRFARGEISTEERSEVCEILRQNPLWLRWLADRVKLSRIEATKKDTAVVE